MIDPVRWSEDELDEHFLALLDVPERLKPLLRAKLRLARKRKAVECSGVGFRRNLEPRSDAPAVYLKIIDDSD